MKAILDLAAAATNGAALASTDYDIQLVGRLFVPKATNGQERPSIDQIQEEKAKLLGFSFYLHVI